MQRSLTVAVEHYPIAGSFAISRETRTIASVVVCTISDGIHVGRGECVPYPRYGEAVQSVCAAIESLRPEIAAGLNRLGLRSAMPAGAARNAVDCALWDLEIKSGHATRGDIAGRPDLPPLTTAFTISFGPPEQMAAAARATADRPLLKVKIGGDGDHERMAAVSEAAPASRLIADANEGWNSADLEENLAAARGARFELVEQPLPAAQDGILRHVEHVVAICADESAHMASDLNALCARYDAVNIKLDKAGGLTEAILMRSRARELGLSIMVGCMVGTSLSMAPAFLLAQDADYVDLDGPLLLARDRDPGLCYRGSLVHPPDSALWG